MLRNNNSKGYSRFCDNWFNGKVRLLWLCIDWLYQLQWYGLFICYLSILFALMDNEQWSYLDGGSRNLTSSIMFYSVRKCHLSKFEKHYHRLDRLNSLSEQYLSNCSVVYKIWPSNSIKCVYELKTKQHFLKTNHVLTLNVLKLHQFSLTANSCYYIALTGLLRIKIFFNVCSKSLTILSWSHGFIEVRMRNRIGNTMLNINFIFTRFIHP